MRPFIWLAIASALVVLAAGQETLLDKLKARLAEKKLEREQRKAEKLAEREAAKAAKEEEESTTLEDIDQTETEESVNTTTAAAPKERCYKQAVFCRNEKKCARQCAKFAKKTPGIIGLCAENDKGRTECCCKLP